MVDAKRGNQNEFMKKISVVIIAKNESHIIGRTMQALHGLTDDILVVDSGSTDNTREIVVSNGGRVIDTAWKGFGETKNIGTVRARYDWILSLDADEVIDEELKSSIMQENFTKDHIVYELRHYTYFGDKRMRYGEWGRPEWHTRIFNRNNARWNMAKVHEKLIIPAGTEKKTLKGHVKHFTVKNLSDYSEKTVEYAMLNAQEYFKAGKRAGWFKIRVAPAFSFVWNYLIRLGFLDGHEGYLTAKMTGFYTFLKYAKLQELERRRKSDEG